MKELLQHFREQPKKAIKEVAMCVMWCDVVSICNLAGVYGARLR